MNFFYKDKFNPKDSALSFTFVVIMLVAVSFIAAIIVLALPRLARGGSFNYLAIALTQGAIFFTSYLYCKINKIVFVQSIGLDKRMTPKKTAFSILTGCTMIFALLIPAVLFIKLLNMLGFSESAASTDIYTAGDLILGTLFFAVLPAVCEEILFRGIILQGLRRYGDFFAVTVSSLLFMFMHQNPSQTLFPFLSGLVMGFVFIKTGNIKYTMIIHFINNFISVLWEFIFNNTSQPEQVFLELSNIELIFVGVGIIGFIIAMVYFIRLKKERYENPQPKIIRQIRFLNPYYMNRQNPYNNPYNNPYIPQGVNPYTAQNVNNYNPYSQNQYNPYNAPNANPYNGNNAQNSNPYNGNNAQNANPYNGNNVQNTNPYNANNASTYNPYNAQNTQGVNPYTQSAQGVNPYTQSTQGINPYTQNAQGVYQNQNPSFTGGGYYNPFPAPDEMQRVHNQLFYEGYIYNPKNGAYYLPDAADVQSVIPPNFEEVSKDPRLNPYFISKGSFWLYSLGGIIISAVLWLYVFFA